MEKVNGNLDVQNMTNGIKKATLDDFPELVRINIECWKHNYKGIIPQEYLDQLTVEEKLPKWESYFLQEKENTVYYIKLIDGKTVGFISGGENKNTEYPYECEIHGLYIDIDYQGRSIGKELFETLMNDEKFKNCKSFFLFTLKDNPQSNGFYKKMGGTALNSSVTKTYGSENIPLEGYVREK